MHEAGAVHRDGREPPALDQVDDERAEADLDRVRAHAEHDGPAAPDRARDALGGGAEVARREDVGQAVEEARARCSPARDRAAERDASRPCSAAAPSGTVRTRREVERRAAGAAPPRRGRFTTVVPEEPPIDELAEHVADQDVRLLDARRERARRDAEADVDRAGERAAVAAGEPDGADAELARRPSTARSTFGELPLVEIATATSPRAPSARTWRAKTSS